MFIAQLNVETTALMQLRMMLKKFILLLEHKTKKISSIQVLNSTAEVSGTGEQFYKWATIQNVC